MVVGDRAGLFGRGTVGEGNDVESLSLPGVQRELVEAVTATGKPVVMVVLSGRPYELGWAVSGPTRPDALLQAFFPGEEGGRAIADVLSGRVGSVRPPAGLAAAFGRCAAVLLPAPEARRVVGDHERRQHSGAAVRARTHLYDVRAHRT